MTRKKIEDCMTSELLFHALKTPCIDRSNSFMEEYNHRQNLLGLTPQQKRAMYLHDEKAILDGSSYIDVHTPLAATPDGFRTTNFIIAPTLSELVKYANAAVLSGICDDVLFMGKPWDIACQNALYRSDCMEARVLRNVLNFDVELTVKQVGAFICQEFSPLKRLYYHIPDEKAA